MYVYVCMYVCMYVCIYVCIFIKLHITAQSGPVILVVLCHSHLCIYVSMYLCIYVSMYLRIYVSMYLWMNVCMYVCMDGWMDVWMNGLMCVCWCVCVCVFIKLHHSCPAQRRNDGSVWNARSWTGAKCFECVRRLGCDVIGLQATHRSGHSAFS